ncbi:MAG: hypothetical protein E7262_02860 [Lachnospiraceae bacterium]|nr:hypothetical protein [Lachnospiraceae bacterium]
MTIEEKLENFKASALKDAKMQSSVIIKNSEDNIRTKLEEYELRAKEDYENKVRLESSMIISKNNQDITKESLIIKQKVEKRRLELINNLFKDLEKKLKEFKKSSEYEDLLIAQIEQVKSYAKEADFIIYIDKTDRDLMDKIANASGAKVEINKNNIIGGIKAVIEEKNILLDYSFADKLHEEKLNFSF